MKPFMVVLSVVSLMNVIKAHGTKEEREPETSDWREMLKNIGIWIHRIDTYFTLALDLIGASDGSCRFNCSDGYTPVPRPDYKSPRTNGCSSVFFGFQFDIPAITECYNQHDQCYDTCGRDKNDCDEQLQICLEAICRNVQNTLGLPQSVQACESALTILFDAFIHLGCRPYLDSQKSSCICHYEEKTDL